MTFRKLDPQSVESSDGFVLRSRGRYAYEYVERDHVLKVAVEPRRDPTTHEYFEVVLEESFSRWLPPFEDEQVPSDKRAEIARNVEAALGFLRIPHRFE
jgi:hypothetical protein